VRREIGINKRQVRRWQWGKANRPTKPFVGRCAIDGGRISEVTALTWVINALEQGRLRFARRGQTWHLDYKDKPTRPDRRSSPIDVSQIQ